MYFFFSEGGVSWFFTPNLSWCRTGYQWPVINCVQGWVMMNDWRYTTGSRYRSVAPAGRRSWDFHNRRDKDSYLTILSMYWTSSRFPEMLILKWVLPNIINVFYSCLFMSDNYQWIILLDFINYIWIYMFDLCLIIISE